MNKNIIGILALLLSVTMSVILIFQKSILIPNGYDLAINGYVVAHALAILFFVNLIARIGFWFLNKKD